MSGFKNFIMRGNLVEQFVSSFVNPLLSLVGGTPDFGNLKFHLGKATFTYGAIPGTEQPQPTGQLR